MLQSEFEIINQLIEQNTKQIQVLDGTNTQRCDSKVFEVLKEQIQCNIIDEID